MPEIVERGHLFIAQPPLYKLKKGKKEVYIQNDEELENFLLNQIEDGIRVTLVENGKVLEGPYLTGKIKMLRKERDLLSLMERKGLGEDVFQVLLTEANIETIEYFADRQNLLKLSDRLQKLDLIFDSIEEDEQYEGHRLIMAVHNRGHQHRLVFDYTFMHSPEFKMLKQYFQDLSEFNGIQFEIRYRENEPIAAKNKAAMLESIQEISRKGYQMTRFKGLGEMNPDQLWDTTLDPEKRTLLRVQIEDAVEADHLFSLLMGDEVEPRREFIETNALNVKNLDV
jgi:DNA gyrase subunit B